MQGESGTDPLHIKWNADCIFKDAKCFILKEFWQDQSQISQGDTFIFQVNGASTTFEMPVLYTSGGDAYSVNNVNSLVNSSSRVVTGRTGESNTNNVFQDYVADVFGKAGLNVVDVADCMLYHEANGDIHCGTNAKR